MDELRAEMVNYHDPHTIVHDFVALVHVHRAFTGIFIWELLTTLDFEWDVIRGRRPYRRTIWIYTLARMATLGSIIAEIIGSETTTEIHCQVWGTLAMAFPNIALAAASLLIVLRIMAVWNREKIAILIAVGVWLTDVAFLLSGVIRVRVSWSQARNTCILLNPGSTEANIIGSLIADVVLLLIMLIGLLYLHFGAGDAYGLGRVLWKQGLIWLLLAIICEIPPTVFIFLDLNEPLDYLFQAPNIITMTIASTRMYRSLMDLGSSEISQESLWDSGRTVSKMRVRTGPIPLSHMESVRTENDQPSKSQMAGSSSYTSTDSHARYKAHEMST